jgi:hypothetical protein
VDANHVMIAKNILEKIIINHVRKAMKKLLNKKDLKC